MAATHVVPYPLVENGKHCLNCRHCVRIVLIARPILNTILVDNPQDTKAPLRCRLGYWGTQDDGKEKVYANPWSAAKSPVLRIKAARCPEYNDDD